MCCGLGITALGRKKDFQFEEKFFFAIFLCLDHLLQCRELATEEARKAGDHSVSERRLSG
jgi:hypothetical protein